MTQAKTFPSPELQAEILASKKTYKPIDFNWIETPPGEAMLVGFPEGGLQRAYYITSTKAGELAVKPPYRIIFIKPVLTGNGEITALATEEISTSLTRDGAENIANAHNQGKFEYVKSWNEGMDIIGDLE